MMGRRHPYGWSATVGFWCDLCKKKHRGVRPPQSCKIYHPNRKTKAKKEKKPMRRAQIRHTKAHVLVLCNLGHIVDSQKIGRGYGGSMFESELTFRHKGDRFDRLATACKGSGHKRLEKKLSLPKKTLRQLQLFPKRRK